ncbi:MAG: VOC family protein [Sulfurimonas sp.]|nr:VOC family protein [Sulfurimonas sp.]
MNNKIQTKASFPVFIVEDLNKAKEFYVNNFDFNVVFENEWYIHFVSNSGIQIGFMLPNQPTQPDIFHNTSNGDGVIFSIEVDSADEAYKNAKENSLKIVLELKSEDWGQYHFCIKDPNGIYLDIVQSFEPTEE